VKTFQLEIITPERTILKTDVASLVVQATGGKMGVLAHHAPIVASLEPGPLKVTLPDGSVHLYALGGGFIEVAHDVARVLADSGERADEIDEERARRAEQRARQRLEEGPADLDVARAEAALARALVRLKAAKEAPGYSMGGARERFQTGAGAPH
jgi:F-type H+-transporting ATPase subunit epsilon